MGRVKKIQQFLRNLEEFFIVFLVSLLVVFSFLQLILRLFFSFGFPWADIFLRHLVLWIGFVGGGLAVEEARHFAIDLFKKNLTEKYLAFGNIFIDLFALITLSFLSRAGFGFWRDEFHYKSILFTFGQMDVPSYYFNAIIPIGFLLLLFHFLLKMVEDLFVLFQKIK